MKISLTRLLNEIKLANKKIDKKLAEDVKFFDVMSGGKLRTYRSEKDMKDAVDAHLKSIQDLITLRDKYKTALLEANNKTKVKIGKTKYTIAEAIAKKDTIYQEQNLLNKIARQLQDSENRVQVLENQNEDKLDDLIRASIGKDKKTDASEIEAISKVFRDNNKVSLVDASGTKSFLEKRQEEIEDFLNNIDFALSEINAKTEVEV